MIPKNSSPYSRLIIPVLFLFNFVYSMDIFRISRELPIPLLDKCEKRNVWLEVEGIEVEGKCQDGILKLFICYRNQLNSSGSAKSSRRFQMMNQGTYKFKDCHNHDNYGGLLITIEKSENDFTRKLTIEGSSGFSISCTLLGGTLSILLRSKTSPFSSLKQCSEGLTCEQINHLGSAFDQTDKASFLDDFGGIWSLGMEMLQHEKNGNNYRKNKNITYYTNCDAWSINFTYSDEAASCIKKMTATKATLPYKNKTTKSTTKSMSTSIKSMSTSTTIKPLGSKEILQKTQLNVTKLQFQISLFSLGCNKTLRTEENRKLEKRSKDMSPKELRKEKDRIEKRACYLVHGPEYGDCHQWNSVELIVCYIGFLDQQNIEARFKLPNRRGNRLAKFCKKHRPKGSKMKRHGFAVGVCSQRINFTHNQERREYALTYRMHVNITSSFSTKIYKFTKKVPITGPIKNDNTYDFAYDETLFNHDLTILIGKSSVFATLVDPHDQLQDYATNIEKNLNQSFRQIAIGNDSLGLLGRDLVPQHPRENQNWSNLMQVFHRPKESCGNHMELLFNDTITVTKLDCYRRRQNMCDRMGYKNFTKLMKGNHDLVILQDKCRHCSGEGQPPLPSEIPSRRLYEPTEPTEIDLIEKNIKKEGKRMKRQAEGPLLMPECDDAEKEEDYFFMRGIYLTFPPTLELLIEKLRNCCTEQTFDQNFRKKRQLTSADDVKRWKTNNGTISYRFATDIMFEKDDDKWKKHVTDGLDLISDVTCLKFKEDDNALQYIYFDGLPFSACGNKFLGFKKNIHPIHCTMRFFLNANMATAAHEVLHALGLYHEQARLDQEQYIWINKDIINQVNQYLRQKTDQRGLPYDFGSVMHYPISIRSGQYDIITREESFQHSVRREGGLSFKDAKLLNLIYCTTDYPYHAEDPLVTRCEIGTPKWESCKNGGYLDPLQNCEKCRCSRGYSGDQCTELVKNDPFCGPNELIAKSNWQSILYPPTTTAERPTNCTWRIRKNPLKTDQLNDQRIMLEFIENGFNCEETCEEWLEIKYKKKKEANGAHFCCNYTDSNNSYTRLPVITAEEDVMEVLLILYDPFKRASFKLNYKDEKAPFEPGNKCPSPPQLLGGENLNPGDGPRICLDPKWKHEIPCENITANIAFFCPWTSKLEINGIDIKRFVRACTDEEIKTWNILNCMKCNTEQIEFNKRLLRECQEAVELHCLSTGDREGDQYYYQDADGDMIRVSEIHCRPREDVDVYLYTEECELNKYPESTAAKVKVSKSLRPGSVLFFCKWTGKIEINGIEISREKECTEEEMKKWRNDDIDALSEPFHDCKWCTAQRIDDDENCQEMTVIGCTYGKSHYWKNASNNDEWKLVDKFACTFRH